MKKIKKLDTVNIRCPTCGNPFKELGTILHMNKNVTTIELYCPKCSGYEAALNENELEG